MQSQRTRQILTVIVVPLALLPVTSTLLRRSFRENQMTAHDGLRESLLMAEPLRAGRDPLTGAVRVCTATGDNLRYQLLQGVSV
jgi:hypothetical protein